MASPKPALDAPSKGSGLLDDDAMALEGLRKRLSAHVTSLSIDQERALDSFISSCTGDSRSSAVSRSEFESAVASLGWSGDIGAAWAELAEQAKDAQGVVVHGSTISSLARQDLEALYKSSHYNVDRLKVAVEEEVRNLIRRQFEAMDADSSGTIEKDEVMEYGRKTGMEEALKCVLDADWGKDGVLDFNEFTRAVLILNGFNDDEEREKRDHGLYPVLFNPTHGSGAMFIKRMERFAENHKAMEHPIYDRLVSRCSAAQLLEFLREYRCFRQTYTDSLEKLMVELPDADRALLQENLDEELGTRLPSKQEQRALKAKGIDVQAMLGVEREELLLRALKALGREAGIGEEDAIAEPSADSPGRQFAADMAAAAAKHGPMGRLAVLFFASVHIAPMIHEKILNALEERTRLTPAELVFFTLHISCDSHATRLLRILEKSLSLESARKAVYAAVSAAMSARWTFLEEMVPRLRAQTGPQGCVLRRNATLADFYDKQYTKWERKKPNCLSDFTGRPVVFESLQPHIAGKRVLDVGCGEGYCAREVRRMGAQKVIGVDISEQMIISANNAEDEEPLGNLFYVTGDATKVEAVVKEHGPSMGIVSEGELGVFDAAMAVFLFNYLSIKEMRQATRDVFTLLKPSGVFVFSVPHPAMTVMEQPESDSRFHFATGGYYSSRDQALEGQLMTRDGKTLSVRNHHKTIGDYTQMIEDLGFKLLTLREASVTEEHLALDPEFFGSMMDRPLHLVFKVQKPDISDLKRRGLGSDLQLMPAQIFWTGRQLKDSGFCTVPLPAPVWQELRQAVVLLVQQRGRKVDTYDIGETGLMPQTMEFGKRLRRMLVHDTGAVLTRLPIEEFAPPTGIARDDNEFEEMSKMAYFLVCSATGRPDESTRGRCFDVRAVKGLDPKQANVLFSVVDTESGWHTDGASVDRFVDTTALLSIRKATKGGAFQVANACNALAALRGKLPPFLLYELTRHLPRDVLEKGAGKGTGQDYFASQRKNPEMVALRIFRNNFPIYDIHQDAEDQQTHMRFRFMRFWINSGHEKARLPVSPFLHMACDFLEQALTDACCFNRPMEAGEVVIANNHLVAHARDAFKDDPNLVRGRHKVRVWIQLLPMEQELLRLAREEEEMEEVRLVRKKKAERALTWV